MGHRTKEPRGQAKLTRALPKWEVWLNSTRMIVRAWTKSEVRAQLKRMFPDQKLPEGLGEHIRRVK